VQRQGREPSPPMRAFVDFVGTRIRASAEKSGMVLLLR
jgi:hypothetical protein